MTSTHHSLLALVFLVLGLCVGSCLNVCIARIPIGLSVFRPRSHCPPCRAPIHLRDNIPVLSWIMLRGKCRHCRAPISIRYTLVELAAGILFAVTYLIDVALSQGDPWEEAGFFGVLVTLLVWWALISLS